MKKAFIFDLDGTVADTLANLTHYVNRTTAAFGLSSLSKEKIRCYVGNGSFLWKGNSDQRKDPLLCR